VFFRSEQCAALPRQTGADGTGANGQGDGVLALGRSHGRSKLRAVTLSAIGTCLTQALAIHALLGDKAASQSFASA
jgi:hypothetical protein